MVHQFGPVVKNLDLDAGRQGRPHLGQLLPQPVGDVVAILAHEHESQAEHDLAPAVSGDRPAADLVAELDIGHVPDLDR